MNQFMRTYLCSFSNGQQILKFGNTKDENQTTLRISFNIEKSEESEPNNAIVQIWNLSKESRDFIEGKKVQCTLKAGYAMNMAIVLVGTVSAVTTTRDGADVMTEIEVVDGLFELQNTAVTVSYKGKTDSKKIYKKIAKEMGLAIRFGTGTKFKKYKRGFAFVGAGRSAMDKLSVYNGHRWSIQNGVIYVVIKGKPISAKKYLLSPTSGLIDEPKKITIGTGDDAKSGWEISYLLNGAIGVNHVVTIDSSKIQGDFRVKNVKIVGDNLSGDWVCTSQVLKV